MSETCQCKRGRPQSQAESEVHAWHPLGKRRQERNVPLVHGTTLSVARNIRDQRCMARQRTFFALGVNRKHGDTLRLRLAGLVARFRRRMTARDSASARPVSRADAPTLARRGPGSPL